MRTIIPQERQPHRHLASHNQSRPSSCRNRTSIRREAMSVAQTPQQYMNGLIGIVIVDNPSCPSKKHPSSQPHQSPQSNRRNAIRPAHRSKFLKNEEALQRNPLARHSIFDQHLDTYVRSSNLRTSRRRILPPQQINKASQEGSVRPS